MNGLHAPEHESGRGQPYAGLFTMEDARVEGGTLLLEVTPTDNRPSRLFQMAQARDMLFAAC